MSKIFIITGPSGAGEDSVIKGLKDKIEFEKIVTTTTREMRPGEVNGKDYYFIDKAEFEKGIENNEFFEWAEEDNGQLYGCTYKEIERIKKTDKIYIWKIEYKGVITAKKILPEAVSIFLYIPIETVESRLRHRGCHSEEFIKDRLEYAQGWYDNRAIFDHEVENEDGKLDQTIEKVLDIIKGN